MKPRRLTKDNDPHMVQSEKSAAAQTLIWAVSFVTRSISRTFGLKKSDGVYKLYRETYTAQNLHLFDENICFNLFGALFKS